MAAHAPQVGHDTCQRGRRARRCMDFAAHALDGAPEALFVEGFQQVVEGAGIEGPKRIVLECGGEHHERHCVGTDRIDDFKAVDIRHAYVEEHHLRRMVDDGADGCGAAGARLDQCEIRFSGEQGRDSRSRPRLVVHDQRPDAHGS
jgi:hypothetical protein